jgi:hypothetical protein
MASFSISHDFRGRSIELFWRGYFDEDHQANLDSSSDMKERTLLEFKDTEETIYRELRMVPKRQLPAFIRKFTNELGYVSKSTLVKADNRMTIEIVPTVFTKRSKITGIYTIEQVDPDTIRRTYVGDIEIKVALIGKKIEKAVIEDMQRSFAAGAECTQKWLDDHADEAS